MALNLTRNSKLLFTSNVNSSTGKINDTLTAPITAITTTTGVFTISTSTTTIPAASLVVGNMVVITGSNTGTAGFTGYTSGNTYFITAVSGSNITISATYGGTAVTTTVGTVVGLTLNLFPHRVLSTKTLTVETTSGLFSAETVDTGLLQKGDVVTLVGAASGTGSITGYTTTGTVYYVIESNVGTNYDQAVALADKKVRNYFKLSTTVGGGAVTTVKGQLTVATSITIANRFNSDNTFEIQVLEGFSFSQNTNTEQITISEAGSIPKRGQRSFNTSLAPVDFSFSTYIRPIFSNSKVLCEESVLWNALMGTEKINTNSTATDGQVRPYDGTPSYAYSGSAGTITVTGTFTKYPTVGTKFLINDVTSTELADVDLVNGPATVTSSSSSEIVFTMDNQSNAIETTTAASTTGTLTWTNIAFYRSAWGEGAVSSILAGHASNVNQLQKFGLLVTIDNVTYAIDNCALNEATIDFGLDGIATIQWTGQATGLRQLTTSLSASTSGSLSGAYIGTYTLKNKDAKFITNKLSTCRLKVAKKLVNASDVTIADIGNAYFLPITGGSLTISNNISYITPAILGVVNSPVSYYTATRNISGNLTAYLNTGSLSGAKVDGITVPDGTGELLAHLVKVADIETEPLFYLELAVGGSSSSTRVEVQIPSASISIPTVNVEQVVSTGINFTAAPSTGAYASRKYDLDQTNELTVRYFTV